jgi:hypothetical protein
MTKVYTHHKTQKFSLCLKVRCPLCMFTHSTRNRIEWSMLKCWLKTMSNLRSWFLPTKNHPHNLDYQLKSFSYKSVKLNSVYSRGIFICKFSLKPVHIWLKDHFHGFFSRSRMVQGIWMEKNGQNKSAFLLYLEFELIIKSHFKYNIFNSQRIDCKRSH